MGEGGRLGKDRHLDDTLSDARFQTLASAQFGRVWDELDRLKEKTSAPGEDLTELKTTVAVLQSKMKLAEKIIWALATGVVGLTIKVAWELLKSKF